MNYFRYKLIESTGRVNGGFVKLPYDSDSAVITYLERSGSTIISVKKIQGLLHFLLKLGSIFTSKKVSRIEAAELLSSLAVMLRSGIPVLAALKDAIADSENAALTEMVEGIIFYIESGSSFAEAVTHYPELFSGTVLQLIRIGEETGALDKTLKDAAEHLNRIQQIVSDTRQALLYPAFVFFAMFAAMIFWFYFVVPNIIKLFLELQVDLPWITLLLLGTSEFVKEYIWLISIIVIIAVVVIREAVTNNQQARMAFHQVLLKIPVVKRIRAASNLAFISEYFNLLLASGVDVFKAISIITDSIGDEVYKAKLSGVRESLVNGESVTNAFKEAEIFPNFVIRMVGVGEQTGTLPEQLSHIAEEYSKQLAVLVSTIGKVIEPIVIIMAGIMFAIIVIGLFLPIYDLIEVVG